MFYKTNYNNIWNGKVEYIQNHTNLSSYQLSNRHEWSFYLYPPPIPHLILIIHFMIYSISNALLSQRIGKLHYFPYLAFLSILFVSIIHFCTLSIRFINYSQEAVQSILLWQNKNHKYDQYTLQPFTFWITNVVTYWIWFTYSIGTNTSISNSCEIRNYKGCLTIWSHSSLLPEWSDFIWAIINTVSIYNKMINTCRSE